MTPKNVLALVGDAIASLRDRRIEQPLPPPLGHLGPHEPFIVPRNLETGTCPNRAENCKDDCKFHGKQRRKLSRRVSRECAALMAKVRRLPPMTEAARREQALDFAYGNLAASTNHRPRRHAFEKLAIELGWSPREFDRWAAGKEWCR